MVVITATNWSESGFVAILHWHTKCLCPVVSTHFDRLSLTWWGIWSFLRFMFCILSPSSTLKESGPCSTSIVVIVYEFHWWMSMAVRGKTTNKTATAFFFTERIIAWSTKRQKKVIGNYTPIYTHLKDTVDINDSYNNSQV